MAFASDSTITPEPHRALLLAAEAALLGVRSGMDRMVEDAMAAVLRKVSAGRDARGRFAKSETLAGSTPELPSEPLSPANVLHGGAGMLSSEHTPIAVLPIGTMGALSFEDCIGGVPKSGATPEVARADLGAMQADHARTLHLRRQLEAAAEHGAALLAALGLPRLVGPDFSLSVKTIVLGGALASGISRVNPIAAGDALNAGFTGIDPVEVGDAIDQAIATLDALDGDADYEDGRDDEPSLGWTAHVYQTPFNIGGTTDIEHDTADAEPSLASPERHPEVPVWFSNEVYTVCGGSEGQLRWAEGARDDREKAGEDGPIDEDELDGAGDVDPEPSIGWPEDFTAEVVPMLEAGADAEHDDADSEDDRCEDDSGLRLWVFGPSRREVAHV